MANQKAINHQNIGQPDEDKCAKSERIRSVLRQLQPFRVRGVNFNNLSTHSSRRLCALMCARGPLCNYPKYILFTLYMLNENRKSSCYSQL
jgi:hypothetical protein